MSEIDTLHRSFIGRQRELALLWQCFRAALAGQVSVVLVEGQPGIGKTCLLRETAARAAEAGATVLWGGTSESEGMPPYMPFLEALGPYVRQTPADVLREQVGLSASVLATILPEVTACLGDLPPSYPLPAEQARLRLYEAIGSLLTSISAPVPLSQGSKGAVLVLDDLQWADTASLDLLCHIVRRQPEARMLVLGACRAGEVGQRSDLERAVAHLSHLRALTIARLVPLSAVEIAALAVSYLQGSVDVRASRSLYAHSEGNPFFAEELLRDWLESGILVKGQASQTEETSWVLAGAVDVALPPSIIGAIRQRLARLPTAVVDQLRIAAVMGHAFTAPLLAQVSGQDVEHVEELLSVADRARLIEGDRSGGYAFGHGKIRECLYVEVSSSRRCRLHEQIGLALEAAHRDESGQRAADLAFHFSRSGDRARGAAYSWQAAREAMRAYAPHEALTHYQSALELIEAQDRRCGELLLGLGEAALLAAAEDQAAAAYGRAEQWFETAGDPVATARAAHGRGLAQWRLGSPLAAKETLEEALSLLEGTDRRGSEWVRAQVDLAYLLGVVLGRHDAAVVHGRQALTLAHSLSDEQLEGAASRTLGFLLVRENELLSGVPLLEQALALATAHDDAAEAAEACACLAQAYCWSADFQRSHEVSLRREALAQLSQQAHQLAYVHTWIALLHAAQGAWGEAEQRLVQARLAVERVTGREPRAFLHQVQGFLAYQQGRYSQAEGAFRMAIPAFREQDPGELVLCLGPLGLVLMATGKRQEALDCMAEQEALLKTLAAGRLSVLSAQGCLALMAVRMGDARRAAGYYADLLACRGQHHWFLVDRVLGQIALLCGELQASAAHLSAAEAVARREGLRPELGWVLIARADLALAQGGAGNAARARDLLGQALALFRDLDTPAHVRLVRQKLRDLPRQPSAPPHTPFPAGLSPREAQVLRLVAAGMSNRQIAETLSISPSTVAKHLTAIYNKTVTDNRAAAVAWAIRHGLA